MAEIYSYWWNVQLRRLILMGVLSIGLVGCQLQPEIPDNALVCESPRPQMCTREYRPVCGYHSASEQNTYSNACVACSDANVKWVEESSCK